MDSYQDLVPLFNPRGQRWDDHFTALNGSIAALTRTGRATIKLLQLNDPERIIQRVILEEAGCWPG